MQINASTFLSGWVWKRGIKIAPSLNLLACESSVSVKENPNSSFEISLSSKVFALKGVALSSVLLQILEKEISLRANFLPTFTCSKLTIETIEQGVKYGQSY